MARRTPNIEPGDSEFSHGKGLMPHPTLADPLPHETLRAYFQTDSVDPETELYNPVTGAYNRTMGDGRQDHKDITNPYRTTGQTSA